MKRPQLIKDRQHNRDSIIEDLQASELERLKGQKKLPERTKQLIEARAVIARERVQARRKAGETYERNRLR